MLSLPLLVGLGAAMACLLPVPADSLRLLLIGAVATKSHYIFSSSLTQGLLEAGHQVVEFTNYPPAVKHPNRTSFVVNLEYILDHEEYAELDHVSSNSLLDDAAMLVEWRELNGNAVLDSAEMKQFKEYLSRSKDKFDVLVIDYVLMEAVLGVAHLVNRPPVVALTAYLNPTEMSLIAGNPLFPALVPHNTLPAYWKMDFTTRMYNSLVYAVQILYEKVWADAFIDRKIKEVFGKDAPGRHALEEDIAIHITNSHPVLHGPRPLVPSIIESATMHVRTGKPLPKDLQEWVDGSPDGFILMSFGSTLKGMNMSPDRRRAVIKTFSNIKQRVLWKFESDDLQKELPPNVRISKWLPQNDLLAHPKIRAFVSHCGGLSTIEASYHAVPVLGIPLIADQHSNADRVVVLGSGRKLPYAKLTYEAFSEGLNDVLSNPKYRENAQRISRGLRDVKETPLERAVWWVEYVGRNGGAPHLRSHVKDMAWYQVYLLDVLGAVLLAVGVVLYALLAVIRMLLRPAAAASSKTKKHSKKD